MSHLVKSCSTKYYVLKRHSNKAVDGLSALGRVCMPRTCAAGEAPTGVAEVCGAVRSGTAAAAAGAAAGAAACAARAEGAATSQQPRRRRATSLT